MYVDRKHKLPKWLYEFQGYRRYYAYTFMFLPIAVYFFVFHYIPMYGILLGFIDYKIKLGIFGSQWVGFQNFFELFEAELFRRSIRNTLVISTLRLICGLPFPIAFALLLNELRQGRFKKIVQTVSYLPHFMSWVVTAGIFTQLLSPSNGMINYILRKFGLSPIFFLGSNNWFRATLIVTGIWKSFGWNSIIYLAAITGINQELYEAANVDGATRWQKMIKITLPLIMPTFSTLFILDVGSILNAGFDQIFNLYNEAVYETGDIIDTYIYRLGLGNMEYSKSTAVGLFKNLIGFLMVVLTNAITKRISDYGIW